MTGKSSKLMLTLSVAAFLSSAISAQSGRRQPQLPKAPVPIVTPTSSVDPPVTASKVISLIVTGQIIHDSHYFKSNYMDTVIKEFTNQMKGYPRPFFGVSKGGEMKLQAAVDLAKRQTDVHVIWLGIVTMDGSLGELQVDYVEYSVLAPVSGKLLAAGKLKPGQQTVVAQGGVMKIPKMPSRHTALFQMKQGAREVVYRLKATGWF